MVAGYHYQRAEMLFEQKRYDLAAQELRQELAQSPDNVEARALLALCLSALKQYPEATQTAQYAVQSDPDYDFPLYALAVVLFDQNRYKEAEAAIQNALRLDPEDPDYYALHANILLCQRQFPRALEAAEHGLHFDPEHTLCASLRAQALVRLGRKPEADSVMRDALAREPENATAHASQGWTMLHRGQTEGAMRHFREALRLAPETEWARSGMIEALKARSPLYRLILAYYLWMGSLPSQVQYGIFIGGWFVLRSLRVAARGNPDMEIIAALLTIVYLGFIYLCWTADSFYNLLLRLDPSGKYLLRNRQIVASTLVGVCLLAALVSLPLWLLLDIPAFGLLAGVLGLILIPISGTASASSDGTRLFLSLYTAGMAVLGLMSVVVAGTSGMDAGFDLFVYFLLGIVLFTWGASLLHTRHEKG